MSWVMRTLGVASVMLCIATSMLMNWRFGFNQGASDFERQAMGAASVAFDIGKVVSAWMLAEYLSAGRWGKAVVAGMFAAVLTLWGLQSAIGFVSETRGATMGGREAVRATFADTERELKEAQSRRDAIATRRAAAPIEAELSALLARPVKDGHRVRGSVEKISDNCQRADARTLDVCSDVGTLRRELAEAIEATRLDRRISELHGKMSALRAQGGAVDSNPQASLIARLTQGWVSMSSIVLAQSLLLPVLLELWAAFGLVVVLEGRGKVREIERAMTTAEPETMAELVTPASAMAAGDGGQRAVARADAPWRDVAALAAPGQDVSPDRFLAEGLRIGKGRGVPRSRLYGLYKSWCETEGAEPLAPREFVEKFMAACERGGFRWVEKNGEPHLTTMRMVA